ncbi:glycosyltransferase 87 family protein [Streptomyces sp. NPDC006458]|uniref:glycosyltransferase 87 family protein n=1 Tax=Streptomyces sp. NPDC006458 TaxID=3154302 RepID=UPI0033AA848F
MSAPRTDDRVRPSLPAAPRSDRGRLLLVLALVAVVTVFSATVPLLRDWFDLRVYHGALHSWIQDGDRLYDYRVPGTTYGFTYPPFAALAMLPMAWLPLTAAIVIALLLNLAALALVLRLLTGRAWRRYGWYGCALAACALALFEPLRDTFSFGQVNVLLLALVVVDGRLLATGRGRWAGIGIGLAAAIKLTPAIFIGLLLLMGRRRAAASATAVAGAATALAAVAAPGASHFYWTYALWDTDRIGRLDYVSNQSLQGILARLGEPGRTAWAAAALVVLAVWAVRTRRAAADGDGQAAFALTGLTACLVSPITWVHHLVWLLPSFVVLVRSGRAPLAACLYAVMCTSVVWLWFDDASGIGGFLGANAYAWITLGLLLWLPAGQTPAVGRRLASRITSATIPAPRAPAPAIASPTGQPRADFGSSATAGATAAGPGAGAACGPATVRALNASSEPTASTRSAASKPQSSSERASS